tara:strand:+ start:1771 stop:2697 length:927 start_codon:yes stop_codon:yes gene_type:complete
MPVKLLADNKPITYTQFDNNFIEMYPVGSVFMTTRYKTKTEVETGLGFGIWEKYGSGRMIVGVDSGTRKGPYRFPNDQIGLSNPADNLNSELEAQRNVQGADGGIEFQLGDGILYAKISNKEVNFNAHPSGQYNEAYQHDNFTEALAVDQILTLSGLPTITDPITDRNIALDGDYKITYRVGDDVRLQKIDSTDATHPINYYDFDTPALDGSLGTFDASGVTYKLFGIAGQQGGTMLHQLTVSEMPSHNHTFAAGYRGDNDMEGSFFDDDGNRGGGSNLNSGANNSPSGGSHNNRQPARQVYMYKRIS